MPNKITEEEFILRAIKVHGRRYCYDNIHYEKLTSMVHNIKCTVCNQIFSNQGDQHIDQKRGCTNKSCIQLRKEETCKILYGTPHYNNTALQQQTMLNKYGGTSTPNSPMRQKFIKTMNNRYGVDYPSQSKQFMDKMKESCIRNFGYPHPAQCPKIQDKKLSRTSHCYYFPSGNVYNVQGYEPKALDITISWIYRKRLTS